MLRSARPTPVTKEFTKMAIASTISRPANDEHVEQDAPTPEMSRPDARTG
jgi:hypothetical protein